MAAKQAEIREFFNTVNNPNNALSLNFDRRFGRESISLLYREAGWNLERDTEPVKIIHTEMQDKLRLVESLHAFYHLFYHALAELPKDPISTSSYKIKEVTLQLIQAIHSYEDLPGNVNK